jgi:hypothetical protein
MNIGYLHEQFGDVPPAKFYIVYALRGQWNMIYAGTKPFDHKNKGYRHYKIFEFDFATMKEIDAYEQKSS